jgi:ELWxxDGT repeat protein
VHGEELWVTDGFSAQILLDATPGPASGFPTYPRHPLLESAESRVVFAVSDAKGSEPWVSDGTPAGTRRLLDVNPGGLGSNPQLIARLSSYWLMAADDGATGSEPWALRLSALTEPAPVRGDVNANGQVEAADGAAYSGAIGKHVGDPDFPEAADLDGDGAITSVDHQLWVEEFGAAPIPIFPLLTRSTPAAP